MTKDEFLETLDRKLNIISERERKDIIDEYRTHIDMKMRDGKSEEEAIQDFGDIDELVDEILDAYKINRNHANSSEAKFNRFMDDLYDGFKRFVSSFTKLDVDDVVRLIFEVLIVLLILLVLRLPFDLISSLGSNLFRSLIGFGIGRTLGFIWELVIGIAYFAIFVLVLVSVITKRINRYRGHQRGGKSVFDDFKESVHDMTNNGYRNREQYTYRSDMYQDDPYGEERTKNMDEQGETIYDETPHTEDRWRYHREDDGEIGRHVTSFVDVLLKIFYILIMVPFLGIIVGLCCALGAMVVMSIDGITLFGPYLLIIGGMIITGAFLSALYRVLWRRR